MHERIINVRRLSLMIYVAGSYLIVNNVNRIVYILFEYNYRVNRDLKTGGYLFLKLSNELFCLVLFLLNILRNILYIFCTLFAVIIEKKDTMW